MTEDYHWFKSNWSTSVNSPMVIAINRDLLYVVENIGHRIQKLTLRNFLYAYGSKVSGNGQQLYPRALCIGPDSRIYVADTDNTRIQMFCHDSTFSHNINTNASSDGQFKS